MGVRVDLIDKSVYGTVASEAKNKMAEQDTHAKKQHEMYTHLLEDFNEITADPKSSMQREWDEEETALKNGGKHGWPP